MVLVKGAGDLIEIVQCNRESVLKRKEPWVAAGHLYSNKQFKQITLDECKIPQWFAWFIFNFAYHEFAERCRISHIFYQSSHHLDRDSQPRWLDIPQVH